MRLWNKRTSTGALTAGSPRQPNSIRRPGAGSPDQAALRHPDQDQAADLRPVLSRPESLPDSYLRYLENSLRDTSSSTACGASHHAQGQNPYAEDSVRQDRGRACFETRPVGAPQHEGDFVRP